MKQVKMRQQVLRRRLCSIDALFSCVCFAFTLAGAVGESIDICFQKKGNWRNLIIDSIEAARGNMDRFNIMNNLSGQVYQFGVFKGGSVRKILNDLAPLRLWGLDSFEGLPASNETANIRSWAKGKYSADPRGQIWPESVTWAQGWYDQLDDAIVNKLGMLPAQYVDIDADLYTSSFAALDFMMRNKLIIAGTVVGYDDWMSIPCTNNSYHVLDVGEGRAHNEISIKYAVSFKCIGGSCLCGDTRPNQWTWGALFYVESVGEKSDPGLPPAHSVRVKKFLEMPLCTRYLNKFPVQIIK